MSNLNEQQFLYHGTPQQIKGDRIVPAREHGGLTYWGNTGHTRGEPSEEHAWAVPDERRAWEFALDRVNAHYMTTGEERLPRATVQAVHPHPEQSPGGDPSIPGEIKAPHFKVDHQIDTMPGRQGTFPGVNWNDHVKPGRFLPGDEDANHPSHLSVQFGHQAGVLGSYSDREVPEHTVAHLQEQARKEDLEHYVNRVKSRGEVNHVPREATEDTPLPLSAKRRF